ncbi:DUF2785 domain-containing protein, partial [Bacillus thuringiensis]
MHPPFKCTYLLSISSSYYIIKIQNFLKQGVYMLQQQLEKIRNNNYIIDNTLHIDSLSSSMFEHIGVT